MSISVRQAVVSDISDILNMDDASQWPPRAAKLRRAAEKGRCYVIAGAGPVIGFALLHYHFFDHGFIELLIVAKEHRQRGHGSTLLEALKKTCTTAKLFTSTNLSNAPMHRLLAKCGFVRCGYIDMLDEGDPEIVYCFERMP